MSFKRLLSTIFLVSLALFMYEITLTRLFSAVMWYHFVFIAVSLAILALGLGGIAVYKIKNSSQIYYGFTTTNILQHSSLLLAISTTAITLFIYKTPFFNLAIFIYAILGSLPFIFGGMFLAESFSQFPKQSLYIYFADLVGSGLGSIVIIKLLDNFSIITTSIFISLLVLVAHFLLSGGLKAKLMVTITMVLILGLFLSGNSLDTLIGDFSAYTGSAKSIGLLEGNPRSVFTTWNSFARTDVIETNDRKEKIVLVDGSAASKMLPFDGDLSKITYLKNEIGYLPFALGENSKVLLIGPGGGMDLLLARLAGIEDITAVEINTGTIEAARKFADFNGNIYDLPGTKTYIQDGRSFISQDNNKYDVIYLSMVMTQAAETLGYALSENYIYTLEAFTKYLNHLTSDGKLALVLHGESDLRKAVATALQTLETKGLTKEEALKSIAYINSKTHGGKNHTGISYPLLIIKNQPFSLEEVKELQLLANNAKQEAIHLPYLKPDISLKRKDFSSWVVTDDSPFFYNSEGKSIPFIIWLVLGLVYFLGRKALKPYREIINNPENKPFINYFILLGLGFMLIEIPLIQKFILFIGHPTLTFSIVIATLLTGGGLGSLLAAKIKQFSIIIPATFITIYSLLLMVLLPPIFTLGQGNILVVKLLITIVVLLPLGLALGIPFPKGIMFMENTPTTKSLIPLMWGINGWTSVLGSIIALMIAMVSGYSWSLAAGALTYLLFIWNYRRISQKV